ncbi:MAG: universal stress protein [Methylovirgula sp.]|uniref:universal stress protein n=1 Tax=Methylovirgula sp. TaxID=1978224 RepID=UPI0030762AFA
MFRKILVGIDGSQRTQGVLEVAQQMARSCGATIELLTAVDPAYALAETDGKPSHNDEIDYPAAAIEQEGIDAVMNTTLARLRAEGFTVEGTVAAGAPIDLILQTAKTKQCDLVILGHRHLSWFGKFTERSVSAGVLEAATVPVLVVPPD